MSRTPRLFLLGLVAALPAAGCAGSTPANDDVAPTSTNDAGADGGDAAPDVATCADAGASCKNTNAHGSCPGVVACSDGAVVCQGQVPAAETCNGADDDCNGVIDDGFVDAKGQYVGDHDCGHCGSDCAKAFPHASKASCDAKSGAPRCVVDTCESGFVAASDTLCVAVASVLCAPCAIDADCVSSPGAKCLDLPDPDRPGATVHTCGQDCATGAALGACPTGYVCKPIGSGSQCVPTSGSCSCEGKPDGSTTTCSIVGTDELTHQPITCMGTRACSGGQGQACKPPAERCNGIDDDCNGRIDDPFRDPTTGLYGVDAKNCGTCGHDCTQETFAHATSVCVGSATVAPHCAGACDAGFANTSSNDTAGCNCQIQGADDVPDAMAIDANCDGIDGNVALSYFVSPLGDDTAAGSLSKPFRTVEHAVSQAKADGKRDVLVAQGVYVENVTLPDGVHLYGGYSQSFAQHRPATLTTVLFGRAPSGAERATITIDGVTAGASVDGFTVVGADATSPGASSYAISAVDCTAALSLTTLVVQGGAGAPGVAGSSGTSGTDGPSGASGNAATTAAAKCTAAATPGGAGGALTCADATTSGGAGGAARCPRTQRKTTTAACLAAAATDCRNTCSTPGSCGSAPPSQGVGAVGGNGAATGGDPTYDRWTDAGDCTIAGEQVGWAHTGVSGAAGARGADGTAGAGCMMATGVATATAWSAAAGGAGVAGTSGGGGGGGSAGSGLYVSTDAYAPAGSVCLSSIGASGGGGGAGGCGGQAGAGGGGGGGSFAIWLGYTQSVASLPIVSGNTITIGAGGAGGLGGASGAGGLGGGGGAGGTANAASVFLGEPGGRGGNGGLGGAGGGGGGGCGGVAVGIAVVAGPNSFTPSFDATNTISGGTPGAPGAGGVSTGQPGADGTVATVLTL